MDEGGESIAPEPSGIVIVYLATAVHDFFSGIWSICIGQGFYLSLLITPEWRFFAKLGPRSDLDKV